MWGWLKVPRPNFLEICTVMDLGDHHLRHSHIRKESQMYTVRPFVLCSSCPFLLQGCPVVDLDIQEPFSDDWCWCCCRTGLMGSPPRFDWARCGIWSVDVTGHAVQNSRMRRKMHWKRRSVFQLLLLMRKGDLIGWMNVVYVFCCWVWIGRLSKYPRWGYIYIKCKPNFGV